MAGLAEEEKEEILTALERQLAALNLGGRIRGRLCQPRGFAWPLGVNLNVK